MPKLNSQLSFKKLLLVGFLLVTVIAIPITVYLVQQQLQTRTEATPSTTLSFSPGTQSAEVGGNVEFDVLISPGSNQVSYVKLVIKFDPTKLSTSEEDFTVNSASGLSILQGPVVGADTISVALSIGSDPTNVIKTDTTIGTVTFNVVGESALPTDITFDTTTEVRSISGDSDAYNENVFLSGTPASVSILGEGGVTPTPGAASPTPEASISGTPTLSEVPTCTLGLDVPNTGDAPYTINFTASGTDIDGVIESVSFDFGDGNFEEATSGAGLSTDSVDITMAHTFETPGIYTVSVIMTDDTGETNDTNSCTTEITITDEFGNTTTTEDTNNTEATGTPAPTMQEGSYNELTPTLAPTGPTETIVGVGVLGGVLFLIGALLFFAL